MNDLPQGTLAGAAVTVADPKAASQLHNKGWHGAPRSGGGLAGRRGQNLQRDAGACRLLRACW